MKPFYPNKDRGVENRLDPQVDLPSGSFTVHRLKDEEEEHSLIRAERDELRAALEWTLMVLERHSQSGHDLYSDELPKLHKVQELVWGNK